jgi:hypothetical protein
MGACIISSACSLDVSNSVLMLTYLIPIHCIFHAVLYTGRYNRSERASSLFSSIKDVLDSLCICIIESLLENHISISSSSLLEKCSSIVVSSFTKIAISRKRFALYVMKFMARFTDVDRCLNHGFATPMF